MKKFVIEYATGSYDSHREHIYTMEAESETDIQLWILAAIEQWKIVSKQFKDLSNDPLRVKDIRLWNEKYIKFVSENTTFSLEVNGYDIYLPDDLNEDFDHLTIFTITELDEWFENTKPEKVNKNEN